MVDATQTRLAAGYCDLVQPYALVPPTAQCLAKYVSAFRPTAAMAR